MLWFLVSALIHYFFNNRRFLSFRFSPHIFLFLFFLHYDVHFCSSFPFHYAFTSPLLHIFFRSSSIFSFSSCFFLFNILLILFSSCSHYVQLSPSSSSRYLVSCPISSFICVLFLPFHFQSPARQISSDSFGKTNFPNLPYISFIPNS